MKRQIANLGMLLVILATLMLFIVDGYGQVISIDPASVESPAAGEPLTLNINITGGVNVAGYEVTVTFDSTALGQVSIVNGDYLPEGAFIVPAVETATSIKLAATALGATAEGDGTLATVSFTVIEAKASAIALDAIVSDPTATPIAVTVEGGLVILAAVDPPVEDDENELVGRWNIHTIDGETLAETFGGDEFEEGEVSAISQWTFDADGTWRWITEMSFGTDDPVSDSVSWDLGGAYTILGSRYTLIFTDEETIAFFGVEKLTGTWGKEGSTLILSYDDGTVMVLQATDTPSSPPPVEKDDDASGVVGSWAVHTIDGDPVDEVFDDVFEGAEIVGVSEWTFYDDGRWNWVTAFEAGMEDPLSGSFSFAIGGTYTITGSNYTLIFDEETLARHEIEPSEAITTGTWMRADSALTLSHDDETVIVMHAVDSPGIEKPPPVGSTHRFELELAAGLNMISLPLMPSAPYTARSFAEAVGATVVIELDTAMSQFVGFTADQAGDGFAIEGGQGYIVNVPGGGMITFTGSAWDNTMEDGAAAPGIQLPSTTWAFVVSGEMRETEVGAAYTVVATNQRTGEVATRQVFGDQKTFNAVWADLSRNSVIEVGDTLEVVLLDGWDNIVSGPFRHRVRVDHLQNAYLSLPLTVGDVHPAETLLGQNFPNPFNPETWIPYQLEQSAEVVFYIYDRSGAVVRTLNLGFKPQGFYLTRSTAAYWDGRNNMGETVASGIYFYSLQTPDFSATHKMLILK